MWIKNKKKNKKQKHINSEKMKIFKIYKNLKIKNCIRNEENCIRMQKLSKNEKIFQNEK